MVCRIVVIVDEAAMFYVVQLNAYEMHDDGSSHPLASRTVTHGKTEEDGFAGALEVLKASL